jgi:hypothetical protein
MLAELAENLVIKSFSFDNWAINVSPVDGFWTIITNQ